MKDTGGRDIVPGTDAGLVPARNDLMRIVVYGEALRALAAYLDPDLIAPPHGPTLDLLDDAYAQMARQRSRFSPEDFGVFVMSILLEFVEDEEDMRRLRIGAARYMLDVMPRLAPDLQGLAEDARELLAETGLLETARGRPRWLVCTSDGLDLPEGLAAALGGEAWGRLPEGRLHLTAPPEAPVALAPPPPSPPQVSPESVPQRGRAPAVTEAEAPARAGTGRRRRTRKRQEALTLRSVALAFLLVALVFFAMMGKLFLRG